MKKLLATILILFKISSIFSQVDITANLGIGNQTMTVNNGDDITVPAAITQLKEFGLKFGALAATEKLIVIVSGNALVGAGNNEYTFADIANSKNFNFQNNLINSQITVKKVVLATGVTSDFVKFRFIQTAPAPPAPPAPPVVSTIEPLSDYLNRIIADYELTPFGWVKVLTSGMSEKDKRMQVNITHLFFDEFGNSLLGTVPQGISNRQYVVHIIYKGYSTRQNDVTYSVKQKTGSFSSALNINNTGALSKVPNNFQNATVNTYDEWKEDIFPLGIATDDLSFDIVATTKTDETGKPVKIVLETQTIKMSPVFHASIDIGLINSELQNSTFTLVDAPDGSANKVIKETDKSPKGIVTVMATFYTSPIVIIEKLFQKKIKKRIPSYKLTGRSYFDDHSFFERIYPTVGVSISSKSFENLFFGLNWELARGLSIFGGAHWGKVNVFEKRELISTTDVIPVTQSQFDFYQNTRWKIDWAYGVKLDISIITNLFKTN